MTCVVCGATKRSHPQVESNWRAIELDENRFYACPDEFPTNGSGKNAFKAAYETVLACCFSEILKQSGRNPVSEVEDYRHCRQAERRIHG